MRSLESKTKYTGLGVALVTPYASDLSVDHNALRSIVENCIDNQVQFLVALGSTGEAGLLTDIEQSETLQTIIEANAGRLPVVAGHFADMATEKVIQKIKNSNLEGVDAIMIAAPAYVKPSQQGLFEHYMAIANECPLPIIIYNVPGRTKCNLEWSTTIKLAEASRKFIGIKEASGDIHQMVEILKRRPQNFFVTSGDDDLCLAVMAHGGEGLISVVGNALPKETSLMIDHALHQRYDEASKIQYELFEIYEHIYAEGNPTGVKAAMEILGHCPRSLRLPLVALSDDTYAQLKDSLARMQGLIA